MINIVLFGPPGAGKGTQAAFLKEKYQLIHIATGDVFRSNIKKETPLGLKAKSYLDHGNLVPDELTIDMLESEVANYPDTKGFIFDGFPRTHSQAESLDKLLSTRNLKIDGMIAIEVEESLLVERILNRGKTSGRTDDQDESKIRNRFKEYKTKTEVLKEFYLQQNKYYEIDGVGEIETITQRIVSAIDTILSKTNS